MREWVSIGDSFFLKKVLSSNNAKKGKKRDQEKKEGKGEKNKKSSKNLLKSK